MIDRVYEGVRVTMNELPLGFRTTPEDPGDPQGPILLGEIPDRAALSLDDDEHRQVARRMGLHDLDARLAAAKEPAQAIQ